MIPTGLRAALGDEAGGVFYLHGTDEYSKDLAARSLAEAHLESGTAAFNHDVLRGSEVTVDSLATTLQTPPMMAPWRVVVLKETHELASSPRLRSLVLEVAAAPPPGLALILVASVPQRSKAQFYPELARSCRTLHFPVPEGRALHDWLIERCRADFGRRLSEGAARALAQALGGSIPVLVRELEKLSALVGEDSEITTEDVRRGRHQDPRAGPVGVVRPDRRAALPRGAPGSRDPRPARGVGRLARDRTHDPPPQARGRGGGRAEGPGGGASGQSGWLARKYARKYARQARRWTPAEIERTLAGLLQVDRLLKAARTPDGELLERWLLEEASAAA